MDELGLLRITRALDNIGPLVLDMRPVFEAEARIHEVGFVNAVRGPELLAFFNTAYLNVTRYIAALEYEYEIAEKRLGEVKAIVMLDRVAEVLKSKGLATGKNPIGSEDLRAAVLAADPDYSRIKDISISLKCHLRNLHEKKKAFEMAYNGVKKCMGDNSIQNRQNLNLVVSNQDKNKNENETADNFFGDPQ